MDLIDDKKCRYDLAAAAHYTQFIENVLREMWGRLGPDAVVDTALSMCASAMINAGIDPNDAADGLKKAIAELLRRAGS